MKHNLIRYSIYSVIVLLIGLGALAASRTYAQRTFDNGLSFLGVSFCAPTRQTVHISLVNFAMLDESVRINDPAIARFQLLDTEGEVLAQSDEIRVEPGKIRSWDHAPLPTGEPTGRIEVRARILVKFVTTKPFDIKRDRPPFATTVELIDPVTGRTTMMPIEWVFVA